MMTLMTRNATMMRNECFDDDIEDDIEDGEEEEEED